jgi:NAD(P)H-hydrate epimerase
MPSPHRPPSGITREQAREIDRRAQAEFAMSSLVLMENAGRGLADQFGALQLASPVLICCGTGNNGGDGFVMARHLDLRGVPVRVFVWGEVNRFSTDAACNFEILKRCAIPIVVCGTDAAGERLAAAIASSNCIVDALLGTGAKGEPRPPLDTVIAQLNASPVAKLAVDIPSGLDCDTGKPAAHTIRAAHTCTFVAAKVGFAFSEAKPHLGSVHVLDIGAPRVLVESVTNPASA